MGPDTYRECAAHALVGLLHPRLTSSASTSSTTSSSCLHIFPPSVAWQNATAASLTARTRATRQRACPPCARTRSGCAKTVPAACPGLTCVTGTRTARTEQTNSAPTAPWCQTSRPSTPRWHHPSTPAAWGCLSGATTARASGRSMSATASPSAATGVMSGPRSKGLSTTRAGATTPAWDPSSTASTRCSALT